MMNLLADITRLGIKNNLFTYDDLYRLTEVELFSILNNCDVVEIKELLYLFYNVKREDILVLVHPESILHSAVEYEDGAVMGQLGIPDMRIPIAYALSYPERMPLNLKPLDLFSVGQLTFQKPDLDTFRGLGLAYKAMDLGGNIPTVFNAANEAAVKLLQEGKISFIQIPDLIERAMEDVGFIANPNLDEILMTEKEASDIVKGSII